MDRRGRANAKRETEEKIVPSKGCPIPAWHGSLLDGKKDILIGMSVKVNEIEIARSLVNLGLHHSRAPPIRVSLDCSDRAVEQHFHLYPSIFPLSSSLCS